MEQDRNALYWRRLLANVSVRPTRFPASGCALRDWPAVYRAIFLLASAVIGALYLWGVRVGNGPFDWVHPQNGFYNQLSRAFAQRQLHLLYPPSPELLALPDPWDPERNAPYSVLDFVLYNRRYYIYHGAAPACLLFTPWLVLTGRDLPETFATFLFCYLGYLCSGGILVRFLGWINLRPPPGVFALLLLALGICTPALFLLQRVAVYEVAISGAYFCLAAGFWFFARGMLSPRPRAVNLALSGLFLGLAIGCRPNVVFGAFFAGLALLWCLRSLRSRDFLAFALPVTACVLLIAAYNYARFRDPFEFGLRYQMAGVGYFRAAPEIKNLVPGLYYLLLSPPKFETVFPFVRLGIRMPFDALDYPLPKRYFVEPVGGALAVWPLTLVALAAPLILRRWLDRPSRALYGAMCLSALATVFFVASLGLVSHRFELDFQPSFVLLGCLGCAAVNVLLVPGARRRGPLRRIVAALSLAAVLYGLIVHLAIGIQGPYDGFVQARPASYVKLARWFSPIASLRPLQNPALEVEAGYEFPDGVSGPQPLIAAGRSGSRYLLTAEALAGNRVRLISAGAPTSDNVVSAEVAASQDGPQRVHLQFRPEDRAITVEWNGELVLRQVLPFLVTAPAQVRVGDDYTDPGLFRPRFPGRFGMTAKTINGIEYR